MFHLWTAGSRLSPFAEPTCHGRVATMSSRIMLTRITMTDLEFLGMVTKPEVAPQLLGLAKIIPFSCSSNTKAGQFRDIRWHIFDTRLYFKNWHSIPGKMTKPKSSHLDEMNKQRDSRFRTWTNWPSMMSVLKSSGIQQWRSEQCFGSAPLRTSSTCVKSHWLYFVLQDVRSEDFDCTFDSKPCVENSSTAKKMHLVAVVHQGLACKCLCSH